MKAGREAVVGGRYGGVVAHAVGGSFFVFCFWCGRVVGHRLVFLFCSFLRVVFWGSAFCLFGWWAFSRWCGMVGVPLLVFIGCPCWFVLLVGVFCVFGLCVYDASRWGVFFGIGISDGLSLLPSQRVMYLSVNSWSRV